LDTVTPILPSPFCSSDTDNHQKKLLVFSINNYARIYFQSFLFFPSVLIEIRVNLEIVVCTH
jgi:hypothetical protein